MPRPDPRILAAAVLFAAAPFVLMEAGEARDPFLVDTPRGYLAPGVDQPFGTDALGRDLLARTLYAAGLSLKVVAQSVVISLVLALVLGGLAGYTAGRLTDRAIGSRPFHSCTPCRSSSSSSRYSPSWRAGAWRERIW